MTAIWLLLWGAAHPAESLRLNLPIAGWSAASSTQVVVTQLNEGVAAELHWLGWRWILYPNEVGRAGVYLPLFPRQNRFEVEQAGRGRAGVEVIGSGPSPALVVAARWTPGARFDLRVTDPDGEVCDSANRRTQGGGVRLRDDPEAPGPHVFEALRGRAGEYRVAVACGRLPEGRSVRVEAIAILLGGTSAEERRELSAVVTRCDEVTDLGTIELAGR